MTFRILSILGTRPQFIKSALLSSELSKFDQIAEIVVNTNQHYDEIMSNVFYYDLSLPEPKYHLNCGGKSHGRGTGEMLIKLEEIMLQEKPNAVLVYGDCNTTLAGALSAVKLHIPVIHVEAGLRSFDKRMPEEINRILTDQVSKLLFCPTETAKLNLSHENIHTNVYVCGDLMIDLLRSKKKHILTDPTNSYRNKYLKMNLNNYCLVTIHRESNTNPQTLSKIFQIFDKLSQLSQFIFYYPCHPRTQKVINQNQNSIKIPKNVTLTQPVSYFEMMYLVSQCKMVITDSGGLQKEAYEWKKPCVTLRESTEWIETKNTGWNNLLNPKMLTIDQITNKIETFKPHNDYYDSNLYLPNSHQFIAQKILDFLKSHNSSNDNS